jgi:hypothetical protein
MSGQSQSRLEAPGGANFWGAVCDERLLGLVPVTWRRKQEKFWKDGRFYSRAWADAAPGVEHRHEISTSVE